MQEISGVRGATAAAFRERDATARANLKEWEEQQRCAQEKRNPDDPMVIIKFRVAKKTCKPPEATDRHAIMKALINGGGFPFEVHRKWHWMISGPVNVGTDEYFMGYLSLSAADFSASPKDGKRSFAWYHDLAQIEETIFFLLTRPDRYRGLPGMPSPFNQQTQLTLASVNACSEDAPFLLSGISVTALLRAVGNTTIYSHVLLPRPRALPGHSEIT